MKVATYTSLDDLPQDARDFCHEQAGSRWFDSLDWFQCLYATVLRESVQPRLYVVRSDGGEVAACLFCCTRHRDDHVLASMSNYYTMEFGPIARPGPDLKAACTALAAFIADERPRWHTVRLDYLRDTNPATAAFVEALGQSGFSVRRQHQYENWYHDRPESTYGEYYASRPSRLRNTIERKGRKLNKSHRVDFVLYRHPEDDIARGVRDYVAVYTSSWKRPEPYPDFMPELARRLVARDALRLGVLHVDEKPAAAQFWITTNGETCIYKLAYDELYAAASVGTLLSHEMFRYALDVDRVRHIDYGVGSEAYKREWMESVREIFGVTAYSRRSLPGVARIVAASLRATAKRVLRRAKD